MNGIRPTARCKHPCIMLCITSALARHCNCTGTQLRVDTSQLWRHDGFVHLRGPALWPHQAQPTSSADAPARAAVQPWRLLLPRHRRLLPQFPAAVQLPLQLMTPRLAEIRRPQQMWLGGAAVADEATH